MHAEMRVPHLRRIWDKDCGRALVPVSLSSEQADEAEAKVRATFSDVVMSAN